MARRTQEERREDTRRRLLVGAARVFAARGFRAASVTEIATAADCSTGALYAHFGSKEQLFLTLLEEGIDPWGGGYAKELEKADTPQERVTVAIRYWGELLEKSPQTFLLFVEFWSVAVRDPVLQPRFARSYGHMRKVMADLWRADSRDESGPSRLSDDELAAAFVALADGFALQRMADPTAISDEVVLKSARLLFGLDDG